MGKGTFVRILKYIFQLHSAIQEFMTAEGGLCKTFFDYTKIILLFISSIRMYAFYMNHKFELLLNTFVY